MYPHCSLQMFVRLARQRHDAGHLSINRQLLELAILFPLRSVGPGFYQMAGFWRRDCSWSEKTGHLTAKEYRRAVCRLNPSQYHKLSQNKVAEKALLRLFGIPSSEYLGVYAFPHGRTVGGSPLSSPQELSEYLRKLGNSSRICFKPIEGWGGRGFSASMVRVANDCVELVGLGDGMVMDIDTFCETSLKGREMVLETYLDQHPDLARLNPSSVNTMRIWVLLREGETIPTIPLAYLRIGRNNSLVDNQSSGGIVAPVELNTGILAAAHDGMPRRTTFPVHPDHGAQIEGQRIPHFSDSLDLAKRALSVFPRLRFAGVDVAVASTGPRIIELNVSPDREGAAFVGVPTRRIFEG